MGKLWHGELVKAIHQEKDLSWFGDYFAKNSIVNIGKKDWYHVTNPLNAAIKNQRHELVRLFIQMGFEVNSEYREPKTNYTPLHKAVYHQNSHIVQLLIQSGANTEVKGRWKNFDGTPMDWNAIKKGKSYKTIAHILKKDFERQTVPSAPPDIPENYTDISDCESNTSDEPSIICKINENFQVNLSISQEIDSLIDKIDSSIAKCEAFLKIIHEINGINNVT